MSKLLYLQASPRADRSRSRAVAEAFLDAYRQTHPSEAVQTLDLFEMDLPPFDGQALEAKYAVLHGQTPSTDQERAWDRVKAVIDEFKSADKYVLAVPMWNFQIPYRLKQYIDVLVQPTLTFNYDPENGYTGLVTGRPVLAVYARGGAYQGDLAAYDHQKPYLEAILGFIGLTDVRSIVVEPTLMGGPDAAEKAMDAARRRAREMARDF